MNFKVLGLYVVKERKKLGVLDRLFGRGQKERRYLLVIEFEAPDGEKTQAFLLPITMSRDNSYFLNHFKKVGRGENG